MITFNSNNCKTLHLDSKIKHAKIGLGVIQLSNSMCERDLSIWLTISSVGVSSNVAAKKADGPGGSTNRSTELG